MKLTLAVPGLVWLDRDDGKELTRHLALPALSTLLGRAQVKPGPATLSALMSACFGLASLAVARQLAKCSGLEEATHSWLIADPVHIRVDRDRALLADIGTMRLTLAEAQILVAALNSHFSDEGLMFYAPNPRRWYAALSSPSQANFTALVDVIGEDINDYLPCGDNGLRWNRLLNEIQMLLHQHPLNQGREERGELPVNSIWFWGEGNDSVPAVCPYQQVLSDDDCLTLLAEQAGARVDVLPYRLEGLLAQSESAQQILAMPDCALASAQYRDVFGWQAALRHLEETWFAPALLALRYRRIDQLTLICQGSTGLTATLYASDVWKFWRKSCALSQLYST